MQLNEKYTNYDDVDNVHGNNITISLSSYGQMRSIDLYMY